jgi:hypothetical protein
MSGETEPAFEQPLPSSSSCGVVFGAQFFKVSFFSLCKIQKRLAAAWVGELIREGFEEFV